MKDHFYKTFSFGGWLSIQDNQPPNNLFIKTVQTLLIFILFFLSLS